MIILVWVLAITGGLTWLAILFVTVAIMFEPDPPPPPAIIDPVGWERDVIERAIDSAFPLRTRDEVLERLPLDVRVALGWKPPAPPLVVSPPTIPPTKYTVGVRSANMGPPRIIRFDARGLPVYDRPPLAPVFLRRTQKPAVYYDGLPERERK